MTGEIPGNFETNNSCGFEGVGKRPEDCRNNPWKYPENYRPDLCRQCPLNQEIPKAAESPLPIVYIQFKQTK